MNINLVYGTGLAVAGALFTFVLYFLGVHNDVEKMQASNAIVSLVGLTIPIVGLILALRATREAAPDGGLSYGRGVLTSLLVGIVAGVLGAVFNYIYGAMINPGMFDTIHDMQIAALEAKGMSPEQIDQASGMMRKFTGPVFTSIVALIFAPVVYTIFGLIISAFLKRAPIETPPPTPVD